VGAERLAGICLICGFWLPLAVCTWLAFTPSPPEAVFRVSDVVLHGAAFAYLSFSMGLAHDLSMRRVALWMLGYGAVIELLQSLIPERSAELKDLLVDGAGIAVGLGLLNVAGEWCRRTLVTVAGAVVGRD
jgi:hypothetical protein